MVEGVQFMVRKVVSCITRRKMEIQTFNDLMPVYIFYPFKNEFTRMVTTIETAGHNGGKEQIIIAVSLVCCVDKR